MFSGIVLYKDFMEKILVSACLMGQKVRYDARHAAVTADILDQWQNDGRLITICPEMAGGLPVPRPAAEIYKGTGTDVLDNNAPVLRKDGVDVSDFFIKGAHAALDLALKHNIRIAVLKEKSPSCASTLIYNGQFAGMKREGEGVTTALLRRHGIAVFSEKQLAEAAVFLGSLEE